MAVTGNPGLMTSIDKDKAVLTFRRIVQNQDPMEAVWLVLWDDGYAGPIEIARHTGWETSVHLRWLASSCATFHGVRFVDETL